MTQWFMPVMIAIIASEITSATCASRLRLRFTKKPVTRRKSAISNPPLLTHPSSRVTTEPASSLAFASPAARSTLNKVGATAAAKKIAAPIHRPSRNSLNCLMVGSSVG